jgi:hypothetical protein
MKLPMTGSYRVFQICLFLFAITACSSSGTTLTTNETATLLWDASADPEVAGYKVYLATASEGYGAPIATVPMDVTTYTITGLETGITYFFVVTAYNSSGAESSFSNEVSKAIL